MSILKKMSVNIPVVEALEQMPSYAMFMKYLVTKKWKVNFYPSNNMHHCNGIVSWSLVEKKEDPGVVTIPFTIGSFKFPRALYDLRASINLISLVVYQQLGLGWPNIYL